MENKRILPSLTTITPGEWRNKVKEIDELGLKEIALFLTTLNSSEREELYNLLEKTGLERIPHVHLRNDMSFSELDYLSSKYKTEVFNVHSENSSYPSLLDYKNYYKQIYVENTSENTPTENDLKKYAGLCFDFAHWHSAVIESGETCKRNIDLKSFAKKYKIGINHVSAIKKEKNVYYDRIANKNFFGYDSHWIDDLSEVDYVKKYKNYLADIISIELENSLKQQLEVKKYLEKILDL